MFEYYTLRLTHRHNATLYRGLYGSYDEASADEKEYTKLGWDACVVVVMTNKQIVFAPEQTQ